MTIKELEQYRALRLEIEHDKKRILQLKMLQMSQYTYGTRVQTNQPIDSVTQYIELMEQIKISLQKNQIRCVRQILCILNFISQIDDSSLREIFKLRFLEGLSWAQVAQKINSAGDGSTERKQVMRYLKHREARRIA